MKHFFIILYLSISLFSAAQTSIYHSFPDSNAFWNVESISECSTGTSLHEWSSLMIGSDTIIGAYTYHQVQKEWQIDSNYCWPVWSHAVWYWGAYRQDTVNRKVYYYDRSYTTERLVYDFNLHAGDTMRGYLMGCPIDSVIIAEDSVMIDGSYRKRLKVSLNYGPEYIIEGIGYTGGPFSPICSWFEGGSVLVCFTQQNQVLYEDSLYTSQPGNCAIIDNVSNLLTHHEIYLNPNPIREAGILHCDIYPAVFKVFNLLGNEVFSQNILSDFTSINRDKLPSGCYIYKVLTQHEQIIGGKLLIE